MLQSMAARLHDARTRVQVRALRAQATPERGQKRLPARSEGLVGQGLAAWLPRSLPKLRPLPRRLLLADQLGLLVVQHVRRGGPEDVAGGEVRLRVELRDGAHAGRRGAAVWLVLFQAILGGVR